MRKAFSLASWNVEHLRDDPGRLKRVIDFVAKQSPDVFALMEVEGKTVFGPLMENMPGYRFHITEGRQTQEILVGTKKKLTAFFTQKTSFKSGNPYLRPGSLLTMEVGWPALKTGDAREKWIEGYSDHGMLYLEVGQGSPAPQKTPGSTPNRNAA